MSSILKALRKLEEEKARRQDGSPDIARDILRRGPRARRGTPPAPALLAAGALAALCLLAYLWTGSEPAPAPVTKEVHPAETPPAVAREVRQPAPPVVIEEVRPQPSPAVAKALRPQTVPVEEEAGRQPETPLLAPVLVLSGIAYQEEAESRLAVVNDLPVMEGTVIEGVRVEAILRDRVRFSLEGRTFEVALEGR